MAFHEVRFPENISIDSRGGPGHSTSIITVDSGAEERVGHWDGARRKYSVVLDDYSSFDFANILNFVHARRGSLHGFRLKDWSDYSTNASNVLWDGSTTAFNDQQIGIGDGVTKQFQIRKGYGQVAFEVFRNLTKIQPGTVKVGVGGLDITSLENQTPVGWTVDVTTGIITFTPAPGDGENVTAGCEFDVPVRFDKEVDELLSGRFVGGQAIQIDRVGMTEELSNTTVFDAHWAGGSKDHGSISADVSISLGQGRVHTFDPTQGALIVFLPDIATLPEGGPLFYLQNLSAFFSYQVRQAPSKFLSLVPANSGILVFKSVDDASVARFHAFKGL